MEGAWDTPDIWFGSNNQDAGIPCVFQVFRPFQPLHTLVRGATGDFTLSILPAGATAPPPGADGCLVDLGPLTGGVTQSGAWASDCDSTNRPDSYARFYSFTLEQETEVQFDLTSSHDTFLFLLEGAGTGGAVVAENDDGDNGTNSQIIATLEAGSYTLEATTYTGGATGDFTLSILPAGATAPPPGADGCLVDLGTLTGGVTQTGVWSGECDSTNRPDSYARFYSFSLEEATEVQFDLTSSQDTFLFLLEGAGTGGAVVAENDDGDNGTNSQIIATLEAGSYTLEATTYTGGATGDFTLDILPAGATAPPPGADGCLVDLGPLTEGVTQTGAWSGECDSQTPDRGHARFYSFTLEQQTEVTITLESSDADTYLYLREGEARSGTALYENDDHEGSTAKSQILETLAAGTYTIEATTYTGGATGDFTLTILPAGATAPPPGADGCLVELGTLTGGITQTGAWAGDCDSSNRPDSYARFYSFSLEQETEVQFDLTSSQDTFLFLLEGAGTGGAVVAENDDGDNGTNSQIIATLDAGAYTVEATTYSGGTTGEFSLDILPNILFTYMGWNSAKIQNSIARYIVENGYGYPTDLVVPDTLTLSRLHGLCVGQSHVAMEIWLPNSDQVWEECMAAGQVLPLGSSLGNDWQSAFVIPAYLQEQYPDLDNVDDLKNQQYKDLFKTGETGDKARLVSCLIGWLCEEINAAQVEGYDLSDHVHIFTPSTAADLNDDLYRAYESGEPWLGYQWGSSEPALLLDLVRLEEPEYSDECWQTTRACAYEDATVIVGVHSSLPDRAPDVVEFLRHWDFSVDVHLRQVVRLQTEHPSASIEDVALYWLRTNVNTWHGWVTEEAAGRILVSLGNAGGN